MRPWWLDVGRHPRWLIAWGIISIPAYMLSLLWFIDFGTLGMWIGSLGLLAVVGPQFAWIASRKRSGNSLHCPGCEYEFAYGGDAEIGHAANCPECGRAWSDDLRSGRVVGTRRWTAIWSLLTVAGVAVVVFGLMNRSFLSALPTNVLIESVVRGGGPWYRWQRQWDEIQRRSLDQLQTEKLARLVLAGIGSAESSWERSRWLAGEFRAGRISAQIQEEYFQRRFRARLNVIRAEKGGMVRIELNIVDSDRDGFGPVVLVLDRIWLEPSEQDVAFGDGWRKTFVADPAAWNARTPTFVETVSLTDVRSIVTFAPFEFVSPGEAENPSLQKPKVRAVVWAFVHSGGKLSTGILPPALIKNPSLDPTAHLVRIFEIEADLDLSDPPDAH